MYNNLIFLMSALILFSCENSKIDSKETQEDNAKAIAVTTPAVNENSKNVEIVFCLDATGSMSGLIGTAKEKIWDIVSDLAQSNDVDTLKMGMVFYRDRGDEFITKQIQLTTDLDEVYSDLLEMNADGGGDAPESVNQALSESVNNMSWSDDSTTYRTIFVVGDCPPHMDYDNDLLYTTSCKKAAKMGITINTIKLGTGCPEAISHFQKMANCSSGEFLQLDQNAKDNVVSTPYDEEINDVSKEIDDSRLYYGNEDEQRLSNEKKMKSMDVYEKSSSTANSSRASYKSSKSGEKTWMGSKEIVKDYKSGKVTLESLDEDELPTILKEKTVAEKERLLKNLQADRDSNMLKLKELSKKRKSYIEQKKKEKSNTDSLSFSKEVVEIMKKQSKKN